MFRILSICLVGLFFTIQPLQATDTLRVQANFDRIKQSFEEESFRPAYAHLIEANNDLSHYLSMDLSGTQREFRLFIESPKALGIALHFDAFQLPESGLLWVENLNGKLVAGPYDSKTNNDGDSYALPLIVSSKLILRYRQSNLDDDPILILASIAHAFRDVPYSTEKVSRDFGDSESCQVNINCSEGDNWKDQSKAVMRISIRVGTDLFWCTGTLMNNTNQDCTPYVLTADHCGNGASSSDMQDWVFYFQYEASACADPSSEGSLANKAITGCSYKSSSGGQGDTDSDFYLVELSQQVPQFYNPYFAGWDRSGNGSSSGVGIHHPSGDIKKVSTYSSALRSTSWGGAVSNTHWELQWIATANGHGVTESGSSGSALFNAQGQVIGMLTGGTSECGAGVNGLDYYGKLSYAWTSEGSTSSKRLLPWLDPNNTGLDKIDGIAWPCLEDPLNSIEESSLKQGISYPNPSKGIIRWDIQGIEKVEVFGADGRRLEFRPELQAIDIEDQPTGIYLIRMQDMDGQVYQSKVTKL